MARPFRQQIDDGILDRAAALFARRGFGKTSVQDVADAVGLSKAGLLHHFPSKDALYEAVLAQADVLGRRALDDVAHLPLGPGRDRRAIEVFVDVALAHPGVVALMLAPATQVEAADPLGVDSAYSAALSAFGVAADAGDQDRLVRVLGALSALAVLTLAAHQNDQTSGWRRSIVATCFDALGHRGPGAATPLDQPGEA
jgi:AcrR family transcriptional regulator